MDRRSFLGAIPAALLFPSIAEARPLSRLAKLIDTHRSAWSALDAAYDRLAEAEERCERLPQRVQYSRMAFTHEPLYAWSAEEIERISLDRFAPMHAICGASPGDERYAAIEAKRLAWVEEKSAELVRIVEANAAECRRSGFDEADADVDRAEDAEVAARVALVLYRPANDAEAAERHRYINTARAFQPDACSMESFVKALLYALGVPNVA